MKNVNINYFILFFSKLIINNLISLEAYYNLDSKLDEPELIGDDGKLISYLEILIKSKDKELFVIVQKNVEIDSSWKIK